MSTNHITIGRDVHLTLDIINRLSKEGIAKLNEIHDAFASAEEYGDCEYHPEHVTNIIVDAVDRFVDDWFDAIGTTFRDTYNCDTIEVILVECGNGWLPSVRSDHWDAPASTIDPELALADPKQAMSWGIVDALTQHIIEEGIRTLPEPETVEHGIRRVVIEHKVEQVGNTAIKFPARILPAKCFGEDFDEYEGLTLQHEDGERDGVWVRYSQTFLYTRKSDEQLLKEFN